MEKFAHSLQFSVKKKRKTAQICITKKKPKCIYKTTINITQPHVHIN